MARDPQIQLDKILSRIDALKKKRERKLARADQELDRSNREATARHNKSYKKVMKEFDPKIAELAERLKAAEKELRRIRDRAPTPRKSGSG